MELNLLPILNYDGKKIDIDEFISIENENGDMFEVLEPVHIIGEAVNAAGFITLTANGAARVRMQCDRCMEDFDTTVSFEVFEKFKKEAVEENDSDEEVAVLSGNSIELDDIIYRSLYMALPSKALCREDCKGICSQCGRNLNEGDCNCNTEQIDPRFDILNQIDL